MNSIDKVHVEISVVLGKAVMPIHQLLKMGRGAVIELNAGESDEVWLLANNQPIARGEIVVQGDHVGVSITEVLNTYDF
ncbi:FliM/FliN family flagellar motor switch protein [Pyruvatibacter sp.]|uniref:FliM/FliN family flagellar motor switch protein n=1 Tax=Pyruvatibacter sp. TaxID=1981328 RepID=UPI0032EADD67